MMDLCGNLRKNKPWVAEINFLHVWKFRITKKDFIINFCCLPCTHYIHHISQPYARRPCTSEKSVQYNGRREKALEYSTNKRKNLILHLHLQMHWSQIRVELGCS